MIRLDDLREAIAECEGEREPKADTCIKLAIMPITMVDMVTSRAGTTRLGAKAKIWVR
jgi:hypothetical protein